VKEKPFDPMETIFWECKSRILHYVAKAKIDFSNSTPRVDPIYVALTAWKAFADRRLADRNWLAPTFPDKPGIIPIDIKPDNLLSFHVMQAIKAKNQPKTLELILQGPNFVLLDRLFKPLTASHIAFIWEWNDVLEAIKVKRGLANVGADLATLCATSTDSTESLPPWYYENVSLTGSLTSFQVSSSRIKRWADVCCELGFDFDSTPRVLPTIQTPNHKCRQVR